MRCPRACRALPALAWFALALAAAEPPPAAVTHTNYAVPAGPWSVQVVRLDRAAAGWELRSAHAGGQAVGLAPLSVLAAALPPAAGAPVAALNGDFYQMERAFAGHPRGLQIIDGELLSAPSGGVAFWLDAFGRPHATNVVSGFQVAWPDGSVSPCGLNEERLPAGVVLYTAALGATPRPPHGRELLLEPAGPGAWLPLRAGRTYSARVRESRSGGEGPIPAGTVVLSLGPALKPAPNVATGAVVRLVLATTPSLLGAKTALGGGPVILRDGEVLKARPDSAGAYESTTMFERHPRSAVGWNARDFFLVEVDGRQKQFSVGMTLEELGAEMARLGCTDGVSFDGGGSAALWYDGAIRSRPSEGHERPVANALVIVRRPTAPPR